MSFNIQKLQTNVGRRSCNFTSCVGASSPQFSPCRHHTASFYQYRYRTSKLDIITYKGSTSHLISGMFIHAVSVIHLTLQLWCCSGSAGRCSAHRWIQQLPVTPHSHTFIHKKNEPTLLKPFLCSLNKPEEKSTNCSTKFWSDLSCEFKAKINK